MDPNGEISLMPGFLTDYVNNKVLDCFFGGSPITPCSTLYVGLSLARSYRGGYVSEPTAGSYARVAVPNTLGQLAVAFVFVAFALEGLGLVVAALADTVPAVQALGQAIFLPVIIIGGVGVPLSTLPAWARTVAAFLPGRYAVEALQACVKGDGLSGHAYDLIALAVIGAAGCVAGAKLFRWDVSQRLPMARRLWAVPAIAACAAVGVVAVTVVDGRPTPNPRPIATTRPAVGNGPWDQLTDAQVQSIPVTGLPADNDVTTPLADSATSVVSEEQDRLDDFRQRLSAWPAIHAGDDALRVRTILSVAAVADLAHDPLEGQIARATFDRLKGDFDQAELTRLLAYIILHPDDQAVLTTATDVGVDGTAAEPAVRERVTIYAQKLLGRLLGKLPDVAPTTR